MYPRALGPLLVACCLAVACDQQDPMTAPEPPESPTPTVAEEPTPTPTPTTADAIPAGWTECDNDARGFAIAYPEDWHTDAVNELTECRWFDPQPFDVEPQTEPPVVALMVNPSQRGFAAAADTIGGDRAEVVTREETTVDGHDAIRYEIEHTNGALYPDGTRTYGYVIDADGDAFYVLTVNLPDAEDDYSTNKRVVDRAAATVRFGDEL